jgi:hypothetical protein
LPHNWEGLLISSSLLILGPFFSGMPPPSSIIQRGEHYWEPWSTPRIFLVCLYGGYLVSFHSKYQCCKRGRILCLLFRSGREVASMILCLIIRSGRDLTSMILDLLFRNREWNTLWPVDIPKICGTRLSSLPRTHIFGMPPHIGSLSNTKHTWIMSW